MRANFGLLSRTVVVGALSLSGLALVSFVPTSAVGAAGSNASQVSPSATPVRPLSGVKVLGWGSTAPSPSRRTAPTSGWRTPLATRSPSSRPRPAASSGSSSGGGTGSTTPMPSPRAAPTSGWRTRVTSRSPSSQLGDHSKERERPRMGGATWAGLITPGQPDPLELIAQGAVSFRRFRHRAAIRVATSQPGTQLLRSAGR